ncbi:MAG: B12-binding domain-containing radical SAM protein [Myxococcales bacterium]
MPTLLLISPPVLFGTTWWRKHIATKPHLLSLAGFVRDVAEVRIADLDMSMDLSPAQCLDDGALERALAEALSLEGVDLVGISCWTSMHFLGAVAVARALRKLDPAVPIVVGGHHPTAAPEDFVTSERLFDVVVRGDGEEVLRELCEQLPARPAAPLVKTGTPCAMSDPAGIDWDRYATRSGGELWVCLSRGCPFKCFFCSEPQRGSRWNRYPAKEALAVVDRLVARFAPRVICFSDPLFGADRRWCEAFLTGIVERRLPTLFWAETRADAVTPRLLELYRDARFKLDFGVDTGSLRMAGLMMKGPSPESYLKRTRATLRRAHAIGLAHGMFLVFNYPGETPETTRETIDFAESIAGKGPTSGDLAGQTFFILPGTEAYRRLGESRIAHGTEVRHPRWWQEKGDHHALATDLLPSAAFRGREGEAQAFLPWQYSLNLRWTMRHTPEVRAFRQAFHTPAPAAAGDAVIRAR